MHRVFQMQLWESPIPVLVGLGSSWGHELHPSSSVQLEDTKFPTSISCFGARGCKTLQQTVMAAGQPSQSSELWGQAAPFNSSKPLPTSPLFFHLPSSYPCIT